MRIINVEINGIKSHNETNFHPEKYTAIVGENKW